MKSFKWILGIFLYSNVCLFAQENNKYDKLIENVCAKFNVPGIAVGVVKDGKTLYAKGFGVCKIGQSEKVDANTLFGIASNSKAFTTAALSILVDRGKLTWETPVCKILPSFKMYDNWVTQSFTVRDLLVHRSGLGLGAGDLMFFPDGHHFTRQDVIYNLRFLKPVSGFRTKFDYDNLLYIVAGEVIAKVSGMSWSEFVKKEIFIPSEMKNTEGSYKNLKDTSNIAVPHVFLDKKLLAVSRYKSDLIDAAGGIYSNVNDMCQWLKLQLNKGAVDGKQLWSKENHAEMWRPQTILGVGHIPPFKTLFSAYGLGWFLKDIDGKMSISHTGGLEGMVSEVTLIPEEKLGIVVLTNQQEGLAFMAISNTILSEYLGKNTSDLVEMYGRFQNNSNDGYVKKLDEIWAKQVACKQNLSAENDLIGNYKDDWFGKVSIQRIGKKLVFASEKSPQLKGEVLFFEQNKWIIKWDKRNFKADAFLETHTNKGKLDFLTIYPISEETDFSFDFQDLHLKKLKL